MLGYANGEYVYVYESDVAMTAVQTCSTETGARGSLSREEEEEDGPGVSLLPLPLPPLEEEEDWLVVLP